jgi:hypothetical protein
MSKEQRYKQRYGEWSGSSGKVPDFSRCAQSVMQGYIFVQCSRKCGHGPDGAYCKQHAKGKV